MVNIQKYNPDRLEADRRILELLSRDCPTVGAACSEIINLEAILNLPKGTEHFVADLHGEYEAFNHILKNASGNIKRKVTEIFGSTLRDSEIRELCSLIYYPRPKLELIKQTEEEIDDFYRITLNQLVKVVRSVSSKYTRSKTRKVLPRSYAYIIEELLHETPEDSKKQAYFNRIIETIILTGQAEDFIEAMSTVIQRLSIDQLHILGDIYDRGPGAHLIMDMLTEHGRFDVTWGNHDIVWMGAAAGNESCIANVLRMSLRYANMTTLEEGYGINLVPLATFAMETYGDDACELFIPRGDVDETGGLDPEEADAAEIEEAAAASGKTLDLLARMHKAIAVIQFKLEGQMAGRHPEWGMDDRRLLHLIDYEKGTITLPEGTFELRDTHFPTIDPADPYRLSPAERRIVSGLRHSFMVSDRLQRHVRTLRSHGAMYAVSNGNLLYHASIPLNEDGTLKAVDIRGQRLSGRKMLDAIGAIVHSAFNDDTDPDERAYATDYFWYLWSGPDSPLFDKSRMTTFERYFIADPSTHREEKGFYYRLRDSAEVCDRILDEFGVVGPHRHIINGHVPVRASKGENPVKAEGRLMVIDGGFSKAYHQTTGIAGYTLVFHSRGFELVQHEPFTSSEAAITAGTDIVSTTRIVEMQAHRMRVRDTDKGREIQAQIDELTELLYAYRSGFLPERHSR